MAAWEQACERPDTEGASDFRDQDCFRALAAVGVLFKVWPPDRVLHGTCVCKWMHSSLLEHVQEVTLVGSRREVSAEIIERTLNRLQGHVVALHAGIVSVSSVLFAVVRATEKGFGNTLVCLDLKGNSRFDVLFDLQKSTNETRRVLEDKDLPALARALKICRSLEYLDLSWNTFSARATTVMSSMLHLCSALTHLNLSHNMISASAVECLGEAVKDMPSLRHLDLSDNGMIPEHILTLVEALEHCPMLELLDLSQNKAEYLGLVLMPTVLGQLAGLRHLYLAKCSIPAEGAEVLAELLSETGGLRLEQLRLSYNFMQDEGVSLLADALSPSHELTSLSLAQCAAADEAADRLADAMERCTALTVLDLSFNRVGDAGACALANACAERAKCARGRRETHLNLSRNSISPAGIARVAGCCCASDDASLRIHFEGDPVWPFG